MECAAEGKLWFWVLKLCTPWVGHLTTRAPFVTSHDGNHLQTNLRPGCNFHISPSYGVGHDPERLPWHGLWASFLIDNPCALVSPWPLEMTTTSCWFCSGPFWSLLVPCSYRTWTCSWGPQKNGNGPRIHEAWEVQTWSVLISRVSNLSHTEDV